MGHCNTEKKEGLFCILSKIFLQSSTASCFWQEKYMVTVTNWNVWLLCSQVWVSGDFICIQDKKSLDGLQSYIYKWQNMHPSLSFVSEKIKNAFFHKCQVNLIVCLGGKHGNIMEFSPQPPGWDINVLHKGQKVKCFFFTIKRGALSSSHTFLWPLQMLRRHRPVKLPFPLSLVMDTWFSFHRQSLPVLLHLSSCQSPELISLPSLSVKAIQSRASPTKGSSPSNQAKKCSWGKGGGGKDFLSLSPFFWWSLSAAQIERRKKKRRRRRAFQSPWDSGQTFFRSVSLPPLSRSVAWNPPFLPSVTAVVVPGHEWGEEKKRKKDHRGTFIACIKVKHSTSLRNL